LYSFYSPLFNPEAFHLIKNGKKFLFPVNRTAINHERVFGIIDAVKWMRTSSLLSSRNDKTNIKHVPKNPIQCKICAILFILYLTQRRFIQEITQKLPNNECVSFINKKAPRLSEALFFYSFYNKNITKQTFY